MDRKYTLMFSGKSRAKVFEKLEGFYKELWLGKVIVKDVPEEVAFLYKRDALLELTEGWFE